MGLDSEFVEKPGEIFKISDIGVKHVHSGMTADYTLKSMRERLDSEELNFEGVLIAGHGEYEIIGVRYESRNEEIINLTPQEYYRLGRPEVLQSDPIKLRPKRN